MKKKKTFPAAAVESICMKWWDFGIFVLFTQTQHGNEFFRECCHFHITTHFQSDLSASFWVVIVHGLSQHPNDLFWLIRSRFKVHAGQITNCDRQQQMHNEIPWNWHIESRKNTINIHTWRNEKMQWMTTLSCMWQMYLSSIITNVHLFCSFKTPNTNKNAEQMKLFVCMEQLKKKIEKNEKERKTSSTLLKDLNYACSARRTHYAVCQFRCIALSFFSVVVVVVVAGRCQDASEWKTPHLMEFHCMNDANTFSRMWMRMKV